MAGTNDYGDFADLVPGKGGAAPQNELGEFADLVPKKSMIDDLATAAKKGALSTVQGAVGIGDIATMGRTGKAVQDAGVDLQGGQDTLESQYSPQMHQQEQYVNDAEGFFPSLYRSVTSPRFAINKIVESAAPMVAGGIAGRGAQALGVGRAAAAGIGEGVVTAGQDAEQLRQEGSTGLLTPKDVAAASISGVATAILGGVGGKLDDALGVWNPNSLFMKGARDAVHGSLPGRIAKGTLIEAGEEAGQSAAEQAAINWAQNKPLGEGVAEQAGQGAAVGGLMGGAAGVVPGHHGSTNANEPPQQEQNVPGAQAPVGPLQAAAAIAQQTGAATSENQGTGANVDRATYGGTRGLIADAAQRNGVDPMTALTISAIETGGRFNPDAKNPRSSAQGMFQFMDATRKMFPEVTPEQWQDPKVQAEYGAKFIAATNARMQQSLGRAPTAAEAYMGHLLGAYGASQLLSADPNTPVKDVISQYDPKRAAEIVRLNGMSGMTAGQAVEKWNALTAKAQERLGVEQQAFPFTDKAAAQMRATSAAREGQMLEVVDHPNVPGRFAALPPMGGDPNEEQPASKVPLIADLPRYDENPNAQTQEAVAPVEGQQAPAAAAAGVGVAVPGEQPQAADASAVPQAAVTSADGQANQVVSGAGVAVPATGGAVEPADVGVAGAGGVAGPDAAAKEALIAARGLTPGVDFNPNPTPAQAEAGNYKKVHENWQGLPLTIENPAGSTRTAKDGSWQVDMQADYGYIKRTRGADGVQGGKPEQVDFYRPMDAVEGAPVYVIDQIDPTSRKFDEHKVILGVTSPEQAHLIYDQHFNDNSGPQRRAAITEMSMPEFKSWLNSGTTETQPAVVAHEEARDAKAVTDGVLPPAAEEAPAGLFPNNIAAAKYARDNGLDASPLQAEGGYALAPNIKPQALTDEDTSRLAELNRALGEQGIAPATPMREAPPPALAIAQHVADKAFGVKLVAIDAHEGFDGTAFGDRAYVSPNEQHPVLAIAGHEVKHLIEDHALGARLNEITQQYARDYNRQVSQRQNEEQMQAGEPVSREYAANEVSADLNGSMWVDPKFWGEMVSRDQNLFRQVAYKFMELATKAVKVATGSRFDASTIVSDVQAARSAIAQAWTDHLGGKLGTAPQTSSATPLFSQAPRTAMIDGVPRPIENSKGKVIANGLPAQAAFHKWFGNVAEPSEQGHSLADEQGRPMVLYHGTPSANITEFKRSTYGAMGPAVYLGDDKEVAKAYKPERGGRIMEVYARGKYLNNAGWTSYVNKYGWKEAEAAARADGWSGVHDTQFENAVAVWNPSDIKSATSNNGSFSSFSPDIRFSRREGTRVIVGAKPGEFDWNYASDKAAPPFAAPVQGIEPRMEKIGPAVEKILRSPGMAQIASALGVNDMAVYPVRGSWMGKPEASFVLGGTGMNFEKADNLSKLLGFAFAQDATIVTQPYQQGKDFLVGALISTDHPLTERELTAVAHAAVAAGMDYTTSVDGNGVKFLHFGGDEGLSEFLGTVKDIAKAAGLPAVTPYKIRSVLNESSDYLSGGLRQGLESARPDGSPGGASDLFRAAVDHALAPYARAVAAEGYRLSPERLAARFGLNAEQRAVVEDALAPKGWRKRSTARLLSGQEKIEVTKTARNGARVGNTDVMTALQNRAASEGLIDPADRSDRTKSIIAHALADEVVHYMANPNNKDAIGWYDRALKAAKETYGEIFPKIKTDANEAMVFDALLGITSQGNDVYANSKYAARLYELRSQGLSLQQAVSELAGSFGGKTVAIEQNLNKFAALVDRFGYDGLREMMNTRATVGAWNARLRNDPKLQFDGKPLAKIEGKATQSVTGWSMLGPKIGSFINNLHGDYSTLTADLWFTRTWNRVLGYMWRHTPEAEAAQYQKFRSALVASNTMTAQQLDKTLPDPQSMLELAQKIEHDFRTSGYKQGDELKRAAKTWVELREAPVATPRGDTERDFQQRTVEDAQKLIERQTGKFITVADVQAALWYHEKALYAKLGAGSERSAPADYADAAKRTLQAYRSGELFKIEGGENAGRIMGGAPGAYLKFSRKSDPFYSALARQVESVKANALPAIGWKAEIRAAINKGIVKQDEVTWSGIEEWLDLQGAAKQGELFSTNGKVSRDAVSTFLANNGVKINEVTLGGERPKIPEGLLEPEMTADQVEMIDDKGSYWTFEGPAGQVLVHKARLYAIERDHAKRDERAKAQALGMLNDRVRSRNRDAISKFEDEHGHKETKYEQYTLPGGENYREVLLTLPTSPEADRLRELEVKLNAGNGTVSLPEREEYHALVDKKAGAGVYQSSHWDEQNVLAHLRMNDRTDASGGRVLFVEEIQSDWAQQGKKDGFRGEPKLKGGYRLWQMENGRWRLDEVGRSAAVLMNDTREGALREAANVNAIARDERPPSAPFVDSTDKWVTLALKRIAKMAVDGGYDKVAFVNGKQSADRYSLSKQISGLSWRPLASQKEVMLTRENGYPIKFVVDKGTVVDTSSTREARAFVGKSLADVLGKSIAEKINGEMLGEMNGIEMDIGGEGMKAFYDKIVPSAVNKMLDRLGGGRMGSVAIETRDAGNLPVTDLDREVDAIARDAFGDAATPSRGPSAKINQQPGFEITPAMREKAMGGLPLFSRKGISPLKDVTVTDLSDRVRGKLTDMRKLALPLLGGRQIAEVYGKDLPQLPAYQRLVQLMQAGVNDMAAKADTVARDWGRLKDGDQLANLMHDSTLAHIDPSKAQVSGDPDSTYRELRSRWDLLTPEAKAIYTKARDMYESHYAEVRQAIRDRIERADGLSTPKKSEMLKRMDGEFFERVKGVYFPLARFGDYVVVVRDEAGKTASVSRAETKFEADRLRESLRKDFGSGYTVSAVIKSADFNAKRDAVGGQFLNSLFKVLDETGIGEDLQDDINQLVLNSMPDLSWTKHGIHRKGTAGFSQDARRAFAQNMFHGSRYLQRVRFGDRLEKQLSDAEKYVRGRNELTESVKEQQVLDEVRKRHDVMMNPQSAPWAQALTSFGYLFHLGLSPASAIVNMTQTPLIAYPILAGRWGFARAAAALTKASGESFSSKNDLRNILKGEELKAMQQAVDDGIVDVTMAHDLAGIAQGEDSGLMWKLQPVMRAASFMFHHAERFNRQATFMAAYRLARDSGLDFDKAVETAEDMTIKGHFDYSAANRPRAMQGNWAKVLLQFKQYAQNMLFTLGDSARLSLKGDKESMRTLGGLIVMNGMAAGALGIPFVAQMLALASQVGGSDDEPWDAKVALQNYLAQAFGQTPAEVMMHGVSRLGPSDISGRVSLDVYKMLFPDVNEAAQGVDAYDQFITGMAGPVIGGIGGGAAKAIAMFSKGEYEAGLESLLPSVLRGPLKAARFASEGVKDSHGVVIRDEVSASGIAGQALGFRPSEVANAMEGRGAILDADRQLQRRRSGLTESYAKAAMEGDDTSSAALAIQRYNEANPTRMIAPMHLSQAVMLRQRRILMSRDGVYLPLKRQDVLQQGAFANEEQ